MAPLLFGGGVMYQCQSCKAEYPRIPTIHAGDETLSECPECNTVEGEWKEVAIVDEPEWPRADND